MYSSRYGIWQWNWIYELLHSTFHFSFYHQSCHTHTHTHTHTQSFIVFTNFRFRSDAFTLLDGRYENFLWIAVLWITYESGMSYSNRCNNDLTFLCSITVTIWCILQIHNSLLDYTTQKLETYHLASRSSLCTVVSIRTTLCPCLDYIYLSFCPFVSMFSILNAWINA